MISLRQIWVLSALLLLSAGLGLLPASAAPPTFLSGGDLSLLTLEEQHGAVYKDQGKPGDALQIIKAHGWNIVRLRLWVHPDGQGIDVNALPYTLALAKRIKKVGLRFLLDLHYSDVWADPAHQTKPAAWKDLPFDVLTQQVRSYSREVIAEFRRNGAMPDIVAVGNETTNGMLWPDGQVEQPDGWAHFAALFNAGAAGVKEGASPLPPPKIMLHIANGADPGLMQWFFDSLQPETRGMTFDVIGLSYYPDGKNTLADLQTSLALVARKLHKPIVIAETGFPHNGTPGPNQLVQSQYGRTPDGQRHFLADLVATVQGTPEGLGHGVIYWQPEWVPISGLPNYDNGNELFDSGFNALPALGALAPKPLK